MKRVVDLRSDTVSQPTDEMREAMARAEVGDEQYGDDPTMNQLEELAAEKVGKEAALFVCSGTMGNLLGALGNAQRGDEVIVGATSHQFRSEQSNLAYVGGFMVRQVKEHKGILDPADVEAAIRKPSRYSPKTGQISIENTHVRAGGTITPPERMREIYEVGKRYGVPVYLDGARIFNAAVALNVDVREFTKYVDSIMFCLSKTLCCPMGSILAGSKRYIERVKKFKQMIGGYMRQTGIVAAAGILALEKMIDRLAEDHENARLLAEGLAKIEGIHVDLEAVQTNQVFPDVGDLPIDAAEFCRRLEEFGVRTRPLSRTEIRTATYCGITRDDIEHTLEAFAKVASSAQ